MGRKFALLPHSVLFAIFLTIQGIRCSQAIQFLEEPVNTTAKAGDKEVVLKCSVNEANAKVAWFYRNTKIIEDFVHQTFLSDGSLRISNVGKGDSGSYHCDASNSQGGYIQSDTVTLTVQYICDNKFKIKASSDIVYRDSDVDLTCDCSGVPLPSYNWTKDGKPLSFIGKQFQISKAQVNDNGIYQCFAKNSIKTVSSLPHNLLITNGAPPRIVQPPKEQVIFVLRKPVMLNCLATGDPPPTVNWYYKHSNTPLVNTTMQHIFQNGSLHFEEVHRQNSGTYKCSAMNKHDTSKLYKTKLVQAVIGDIVRISEQFVDLGSSLSVNCEPPTALPKISNIEWKLGNGAPLPGNGRFKVNGNKLQIKDTVKSDSGIYQCIAKNIAGEKHLKVTVSVVVFPKVVQNPQNKTIIEGENTTLECKFSGDPKPKITWEKDGVNLFPNSKNYTINGSQLIIEMASPRANGLYGCSARIGQTTVQSKQATVTVREKIAIKKSAHYNFEKGSTVRLKCEIRGEKPWTIRWSKVGLSNGPSLDMKVQLPMLTIKNSKLDDSGNYTCRASNSFSHALTSMVLNINKRPVVVVTPQNVTVKRNGSALFHCNMTGYPEPSIIWYKILPDGNWVQLDSKGRVKIFPNGSLLLKNVKETDMAPYTCFGGNAGGFTQVTAYLIEKKTKSSGKDDSPSDNMAKTIGIAVGCAGAYIILVVGLMIYCKGRRARQAKNILVLNCEEVPLNDVDCGNVEMIKSADTKLQFPRHDLEALRTLGSGSYGNVFLAKASGIVEDESSSIVVVQSLTSKDEKVKKEFMKTMEKLSLTHKSIAKLLGVCREEDPVYLISEYPEQGDLKTVMRDASSPLTPTQKVNICADVASGMNYLTNHGHVHKDLAARNCLVDKLFNVKISFLSLNQGTYPKEYYKQNGELIPLRWMAPEALNGVFGEMSDVWSFGILVWEVYTEGILPYEERSDEEVRKSVPYDLRLTKPESCPGKIYKMIEQCWEEESQDRPTFGQLCEDFSEIPRESDF